jgi:ABC-2 type transport system ATP-binding protein
MTSVIDVANLTKGYGQDRGLNGVSFTVAPGEVLALLGPNGAGKTTCVEILEGHRRRDSGEVSVLGVDPALGGRRLRDRIGIVMQEAGIDPELTVREVLEHYGRAYSQRRDAVELAELVELTDRLDDRVSRLSGGQQRRIDLALGLVGTPELVFLDEPTTGFDPVARRRSWDVIGDLAAAGTTVVLTTHYLEEAEQLADRILVLVAGQIVAEGTPDELRRGAQRETTIRFGLPRVDAPLESLLEPLQGKASGRGMDLEVTTSRPTADLAHITGWALARGIELEGLVVETTSLEQAYLRLVEGEQP